MKFGNRILVTLLSLIPIFLLALPADFFDTGKTICLSQALFKQRCYGCGMTKAIMHLIHFDFGIAWLYNPLSFAVLPLLFLFWLKLLLKQFNIQIFTWF